MAAMHPVGLAANVLVTLEALVGLLGFALATGILFARFSQPTAHILFSEQAIIAPYREITAFEFRVANVRRNEMIQVEARVMLTRIKLDGSGNREFLPLKLERERVVFFPLSWTIVHPIDEDEPALGSRPPEDLEAWDAEFLILFSAIDETFSQTVHTRSSYKRRRDRLGRPLRQPVQPAEAGRRPLDRHRPPARRGADFACRLEA